ncbi:adenosylcobinamide-phosphate synthase CbiB [Cytobacillus sp. Hm23]
MEHIFAIIIALGLDFVIGDPKWLPHPVRGFGWMIKKCDNALNEGRFRKSKGVITVIVVCGFATVISAAVIFYLYSLHWVIGMLVEALFIFTTIATKSLKEAAIEVKLPLADQNLDLAREKLSWIVGRDTIQLDESEIVRGVVETVAENTSDGITAPLFFAILGGGPLAVMYRAANTCDSMLGYKNETYREFGWAAAKFDDLLNFVPSRISGVLMIVANVALAKQSLKKCMKLLFRDASKHPSPNSGWLEAAMASILSVQLGGINYYKGVASNRATIGEPIVALTVKHIDMANQVMIRTVIACTIFYVLGGMFIESTNTWR